MLCLASCNAQERRPPVDIVLGGLRQARAHIQVGDSAYRIEVSMLPVRCFDPASNEALNRQKARAMALTALARQLSKDKNVEYAVTGALVESARHHGDRFTLTLRVPRGG